MSEINDNWDAILREAGLLECDRMLTEAVKTWGPQLPKKPALNMVRDAEGNWRLPRRLNA